MAHLVVAFYLVVELAGFWLALLSLLSYRRERNPRYLYFGLFFGSTMLMLLCEIAKAYWNANAIAVASWLWALQGVVYGVAQLLHFFTALRLAFVLLRLRMPALVNTLHLVLLGIYAAVIGILLVLRSDFEPQHIALGFIQIVSMLLILRFRRRLYPPQLQRIVVQFIRIGLVFAPLIGISIYTDLARFLPFGRMTFQVLYAVVAEILLTCYALKFLFRAPVRTEVCAGRRQRGGIGLSCRENEIARLACNGYTNREIAEILNITPHTVRNHLYHIYQKLDVRNRVELLNGIDHLR